MTDADPSTGFESRLLADLIAARETIEPRGDSVPSPSPARRRRLRLAALAVLAVLAAVLGFVVFNGGQAKASAAEIKSRALAAVASANDLILHWQQTNTSYGNGSLLGPTTETVHSELWQDSMTYRTRNVTYASDGQPISESVRTREGGTMHLDMVIYALHTWLTASLPATSPASGSVSEDFAQNIEDQLSAGIFVLIGPETVDGQPTLHLQETLPAASPPPNAPSGDNPPSPTQIDMWIDPTTYLPVRWSRPPRAVRCSSRPTSSGCRERPRT